MNDFWAITIIASGTTLAVAAYVGALAAIIGSWRFFFLIIAMLTVIGFSVAMIIVGARALAS